MIIDNRHIELSQEVQDPINRSFIKIIGENRGEEIAKQHIQDYFPKIKRQPSPDLNAHACLVTRQRNK